MPDIVVLMLLKPINVTLSLQPITEPKQSELETHLALQRHSPITLVKQITLNCFNQFVIDDVSELEQLYIQTLENSNLEIFKRFIQIQKDLGFKNLDRELQLSQMIPDTWKQYYVQISHSYSEMMEVQRLSQFLSQCTFDNQFVLLFEQFLKAKALTDSETSENSDKIIGYYAESLVENDFIHNFGNLVQSVSKWISAVKTGEFMKILTEYNPLNQLIANLSFLKQLSSDSLLLLMVSVLESTQNGLFQHIREEIQHIRSRESNFSVIAEFEKQNALIVVPSPFPQYQYLVFKNQKYCHLQLKDPVVVKLPAIRKSGCANSELKQSNSKPLPFNETTLPSLNSGRAYRSKQKPVEVAKKQHDINLIEVINKEKPSVVNSEPVPLPVAVGTVVESKQVEDDSNEFDDNNDEFDE